MGREATTTVPTVTTVASSRPRAASKAAGTAPTTPTARGSSSWEAIRTPLGMEAPATTAPARRTTANRPPTSTTTLLPPATPPRDTATPNLPLVSLSPSPLAGWPYYTACCLLLRVWTWGRAAAWWSCLPLSQPLSRLRHSSGQPHHKTIHQASIAYVVLFACHFSSLPVLLL